MKNFSLLSNASPSEIEDIFQNSSNATENDIFDRFDQMKNIKFCSERLYSSLLHLNENRHLLEFDLNKEKNLTAMDFNRIQKSIFYVKGQNIIHHFIFLLYYIQLRMSSDEIQRFLQNKFSTEMSFSSLCQGLKRNYTAEIAYQKRKQKEKA